MNDINFITIHFITSLTNYFNFYNFTSLFYKMFQIGLSTSESVTNLKLIDAGVSKDDIMIITTAMFILKMCLPIFVTKYTTGPKPISLYLKLMPARYRKRTCLNFKSSTKIIQFLIFTYDTFLAHYFRYYYITLYLYTH